MKDKMLEWEHRLTIAQTGHYAVAERHTLYNNIIGVPLVALSGFVGAFLFVDSPSDLYSDVIKWLGVLVTILASLQTFFRPAENAELHRSKAAKYGKLKRRVEFYLANPECEGDLCLFLSSIKNEWDSIAEDSPVTPHSIRKKLGRLTSTPQEQTPDIRGRRLSVLWVVVLLASGASLVKFFEWLFQGYLL